MVKLSEIYEVIGTYIELHGDKNVISIGSGHGTEYEYVFNLYDTHNADGLKPCADEDRLYIPKEKSF